MAEVGEITITGNIDDTEITAGFDRITDQLKEMENQFNQVNQPMARTAGFASKLGKSLIAIGTTGVAALTALATKSPVLASTFAKMEVGMLKLSNTVGRLFKPAFEGINDLILNVNEALLNHGDAISTIATTVGTGFEDIGSIITGQWNEIENIIPKGVGVALGIKLGAPFGLPGMMMGAALGYIAGDLLSQPQGQERSEIETNFAEFVTPQALKDTGIAPVEGVPLGSLYLPAVDLAINMFHKVIDVIVNNNDEKNNALYTHNSNGRVVTV